MQEARRGHVGRRGLPPAGQACALLDRSRRRGIGARAARWRARAGARAAAPRLSSAESATRTACPGWCRPAAARPGPGSAIRPARARGSTIRTARRRPAASSMVCTRPLPRRRAADDDAAALVRQRRGHDFGSTRGSPVHQHHDRLAPGDVARCRPAIRARPAGYGRPWWRSRRGRAGSPWRRPPARSSPPRFPRRSRRCPLNAVPRLDAAGAPRSRPKRWSVSLLKPAIRSTIASPARLPNTSLAAARSRSISTLRTRPAAADRQRDVGAFQPADPAQRRVSRSSPRVG